MPTTIHTRPCPFCGQSSALIVSDAEALQLQRGTPVHEVLPRLSPAQRELAISGSHPACWPAEPDTTPAPLPDDADALDRASHAVAAAGFTASIAGTSGGDYPIAIAGPMIAAHWAQIAWHEAIDVPEATTERDAAHLEALHAWAAEADGAGNYEDAMQASIRAWSLEASTSRTNATIGGAEPSAPR